MASRANGRAGNDSEAMSKIFFGVPPSPKGRPSTFDHGEMRRQRLPAEFTSSYERQPLVNDIHARVPPAWPPAAPNHKLPPLNDQLAQPYGLQQQGMPPQQNGLPQQNGMHQQNGMQLQNGMQQPHSPFSPRLDHALHARPHDLGALLSPNGPSPHRVLEPLSTSSASPPGVAARQAAAMEERMALMEHRLMAAERGSSEVSRAYNLQAQQMSTLTSDLNHVTAELGSVRLRMEANANHGAAAQQANMQLGQQIAGLQAELHAQEGRLALTSSQLAEALRGNTDLKSHVSALTEDMRHAAADRAAAQAALERLSKNFQESTLFMMADQRRVADAAEQRQAFERAEARRAAEAAEMAFREDARRQQSHHLSEVSALTREVEHFRAEAQSATAALQSAVQGTMARLQNEEAQLDRLRTESAQQANTEAVALGNARAQIAELQAVLAGLNQQVLAEQAMRRADAQAHEANLKNMESQMLEAQDTIVRNTVAMMESKAAAFNKAMQDLDAITNARDDAMKSGSEHQLSAFVHANTKKEKVGLERMMIIESSIRDIATATAGAMAQLQAKVDKGVADVSLMVEAARETTEAREGALREQVNSSLARIRAYARDMEESLERERLQLEEVVKLEIKGRMTAVDGLRSELHSTKLAVKERFKGAFGRIETLEGSQQLLTGQLNDSAAYAGSLQKELGSLTVLVNDQVLGTMKQGVETQLAWLGSALNEANTRIAAEEVARKQADEHLQTWFDQNQVDQKLNEELMGQEVDALVKCVDQHKAMLQDQMLDEVSALRREQEQLHTKVQAEVEERVALGQIVEAHGDEFEEVQRKIDSCAQQARTLEIQLAEYHGESSDRIGELEAHTEATEKFAAKERAAAKAELDRRLEETGLANTSKLEEATNQLAEALAADRERFSEALELGKKEWSDNRLQDRQEIEEALSAQHTELMQAIADEKQGVLNAAAADKQELFAAVTAERVARTNAMGELKTELLDAIAAEKHELSEAMATDKKQLSEAMATDIEGLEQIVNANKKELLEAVEDNRRVLTEKVTGMGTTTEARIAEMLQKQDEQLNESLGAQDVHIEEALAKQTKRIDDAVAQQEQHQAAMETVMAQVSEESETATAGLQERLDEMQSMIEDEVHQMDEFVDSKIQQLAQQLKLADERLTGRMSANEEKALATQDKLADVDKHLAALDLRLCEQRDKFMEQIDEATLNHTASLEEQLQALEQAMDERFSEAEGLIAKANQGATQKSEMVRESLSNSIAELTEIIAGKHKAIQEELAAANAGLQGEFEAELATLQGQVEALEAAVQQQDTSMQASNEQVQQALAQSKMEVKEQLDQAAATQQESMTQARAGVTEDLALTVAGLKRDSEAAREAFAATNADIDARAKRLEEQVATTREDLSGQISSLRTELGQQITDAKSDLGGQLAGSRAELEEQMGGLADSLDEQLNGLKAKMEGGLGAAKGELGEQVQSVRQACEEQMAATKGEVEARLQAVKAEVDTALSGANEANMSRTQELQQLEQTRATNSADLEQRMESRVAAVDAKLAELQQGMEAQGRAGDEKAGELQRLIAARAEEADTSAAELQQLLNHRVNGATTAMAQLTEQIGTKTRELEERTAVLETTVAEMRQHSEEQHGASEGSVAELRTLVESKADAADTGIGELRRSLESQIQEAQRLSSEQQQSLESRQEGVEAALAGLRQTEEALRQELLQELSSESNRAQQSEGELGMRVDELQHGMQEQVDTAVAALKREMESQLGAIDLEAGMSKSTIEDFNNRLAQAESNMSALVDEQKQQAKAGLEELSAANAKQDEQLKATDERLESLIDEFSSTLEGLQDSTNKHGTSIEQLQQQIALLSGNNNAQQALEDIQRRTDEAKSSNEAAVRQLQESLTIRADNLQAQVDKLRQAQPDVESLAANHTRVSEAVQQLEKASAEGAEAQRAHSTKIQELEERTKVMTQLQEQLNGAKSEMELLSKTRVDEEELDAASKKMQEQINALSQRLRSEIGGDLLVQVRSEISTAIQRLRADLEKEIGEDLLTQKVEEANNELTDAVNREWTRYTKDLEVARRHNDAELQKRISEVITKSMHASLAEGLERIRKDVDEDVKERMRRDRRATRQEGAGAMMQ